MVVKGNRIHSISLVDSIPEGESLVVPVTFRIFRGMMQKHKLNFRRRKYHTEAERKEAKKQSLEKYRQSQKYRVKQLLRTNRHATPGVLTAEDVAKIKESKAPRMAIARKYGLSLRQVQEIFDGKHDAGGVMVGGESVGAGKD